MSAGAMSDGAHSYAVHYGGYIPVVGADGSYVYSASAQQYAYGGLPAGPGVYYTSDGSHAVAVVGGVDAASQEQLEVERRVGLRKEYTLSLIHI